MNEPPQRTEGQIYEGIAFTFCKCATVALLAGKFALPVAAYLCAAFFLLAYAKGERKTRCFLGPPLVIAAFWLVAGSVGLALTLDPGLLRRLFSPG